MDEVLLPRWESVAAAEVSLWRRGLRLRLSPRWRQVVQKVEEREVALSGTVNERALVDVALCGGDVVRGGGSERGVHTGVAGDDGAGSGCSGSGVFVDQAGLGRVSSVAAAVSGSCGVAARTLENRKKREKKKLRKQRRQGASGGVAGPVSGSSSSSGSSVVGGGAVEVPEWRRGGGSTVRRGFFSGASEETLRRLRGTRAARLTAENSLAAFRAERQLELEKAKDVSRLVKQQEVQLMRRIEMDKVKIEKAFGTLALTGNVPGVGGSVRTVVSAEGSAASGGSISPGSSVSMQEVHALMKEVETLRAENAELVANGGKLKEKAHSTGTGYTANSRGELAEHHRGPWGPESYRMGADGKFHEDRGCDFYDFDDGF